MHPNSFGSLYSLAFRSQYTVMKTGRKIMGEVKLVSNHLTFPGEVNLYENTDIISYHGITPERLTSNGVLLKGMQNN